MSCRVLLCGVGFRHLLSLVVISRRLMLLSIICSCLMSFIVVSLCRLYTMSLAVRRTTGSKGRCIPTVSCCCNRLSSASAGISCCLPLLPSAVVCYCLLSPASCHYLMFAVPFSCLLLSPADCCLVCSAVCCCVLLFVVVFIFSWGCWGNSNLGQEAG